MLIISCTKYRQVSWLKNITCQSAFPGGLLIPVTSWTDTLYHSDGIAQDSHLLPYYPRPLWAGHLILHMIHELQCLVILTPCGLCIKKSIVVFKFRIVYLSGTVLLLSDWIAFIA